MKQEPVAIVNTDSENNIQWISSNPKEYNGYFLYTAPRELSDEEIEAIGREHIDIEWFDEGEYGMEYNIYGLVDFARAILKKASEK